MMRTILPLALCAVLPAQPVGPEESWGTTCATSTDFLGAQAVGASWQQIHGDIPKSMSISALGWRLRRPGEPTRTMTLSVDVSHAAASHFQMTNEPDRNHGPDRTRVVSSRQVSIASPPTLRTGELTFDFRIPFDRPFAYATSTGPLCWEVFVESSDGVGLPGFDYADPQRWRLLPSWDLGQVCAAPTGGTRLKTTWAAWQPPYVASIDVTVTGQPGRLLVLGVDVIPSGLGLPTPFLLPGTVCEAQFLPAAYIPAAIGPSGQLLTRLVSRPTNAWFGTTIYMQSFALAPGANPLGVVSSNGRAMRINPSPAVLYVSRLWFADRAAGLPNHAVGEGLATAIYP